MSPFTSLADFWDDGGVYVWLKTFKSFIVLVSEELPGNDVVLGVGGGGLEGTVGDIINVPNTMTMTIAIRVPPMSQRISLNCLGIKRQNELNIRNVINFMDVKNF